MTVCIATICNMADKERGPIIVTCSDVLMSGAMGKAEGRLKNRPMLCGWGVMTAGEDGEMTAIGDHVKAQFDGLEWNGVEQADAMMRVRAAVGARKKEKIEELTMAKYGISYQELRQFGNTQFPPETLREAMWAIESCKVDAECIVWGFDYVGAPQIITVDQSGHVYRRRDFGVIGSGGYLAQSMLLHRGFHIYVPFREATYLTYEAKKHAEGESAVGETTSVFAADRSGKRFGLSIDGDRWAKEAYRDLKPRPVDFSERDWPEVAFDEIFDVSKRSS